MDDLGLVEAVGGFGESIVVESPTLPTEGSTPASARRSVYLMETYWSQNPHSGRSTITPSTQTASHIHTP